MEPLNNDKEKAAKVKIRNSLISIYEAAELMLRDVNLMLDQKELLDRIKNEALTIAGAVRIINLTGEK